MEGLEVQNVSSNINWNFEYSLWWNLRLQPIFFLSQDTPAFNGVSPY